MEIGAEYVRFAMRSPSYFRFIFGARADESSVDTPGLADLRAFFTQAIEAAQQGRVVANGTPRRIALRFWSSVHGLAALALTGVLEQSDDPARGALRRAAVERRAVSLARTSVAGFVYGARPMKQMTP
jgi:hypothetical protein